MLKTKINTDESNLVVQLQLTTPVPTAGNVIEMSFGTTFTGGPSSVASFDTGMCIVPFWGTTTLNNYIYEPNDLYSTLPIVQLDITGTYAAAYTTTPRFDTLQTPAGTSEWTIKTKSGENTCSTYYCTFVCTLLRPFTTSDTVNDV